MIIAFEALAAVTVEQGQPEMAVRWLGVAEELRRRTGQLRPLNEARLYYNRAYELTRAALSPSAWDAAYASGVALPLDKALTLAIASTV